LELQDVLRDVCQKSVMFALDSDHLFVQRTVGMILLLVLKNVMGAYSELLDAHQVVFKKQVTFALVQDLLYVSRTVEMVLLLEQKNVKEQ